MAKIKQDERCEYEKLRDRNMAAREKLLQDLHLTKEYRHEYEGYPEAKGSAKKPRKKKPKTDPQNGDVSGHIPCRRSARLQSRNSVKKVVAENVESPKISERPAFRENMFGEIPGVPVGTHFATRVDASHAGVHRPTVAGIHGCQSKGCYSLALSGGYEDDVDHGDHFTYTGEGGRDLKGTKGKPKNLRTAAQSKDQELSKGNLALTNNIKYQRPVRVLRGFKLKSRYAPDKGYRYDGVYNVKDYWVATGMAGFKVYRFSLQRSAGQDPPPWDLVMQKEEESPQESQGSFVSSANASADAVPRCSAEQEATLRSEVSSLDLEMEHLSPEECAGCSTEHENREI